MYREQRSVRESATSTRSQRREILTQARASLRERLLELDQLRKDLPGMNPIQRRSAQVRLDMEAPSVVEQIQVIDRQIERYNATHPESRIG
jgi:hypothetical protein